jgi:hypothetical protein
MNELFLSPKQIYQKKARVALGEYLSLVKIYICDVQNSDASYDDIRKSDDHLKNLTDSEISAYRGIIKNLLNGGYKEENTLVI